MKKPCNGCIFHGWEPPCEYCEEIKKYDAYLERRRKYTKGEKITSLDELAAQEFAWMFSKPIHRSWFISMQFRTLHTAVKSGGVYYAVKKEVMP